MTPREVVPKIAIFHWGEVIEEYLKPIGLDLEGFTERMTGGWLFGYVAALQSLGWQAVIVCASEEVPQARRLKHAGTGAPVWAVPGRRSGGRNASIRSARQILQTPWRDFARTLRAERCTAVMIQEYEHVRFDAIALLARLLGLSVYATFQGGDRTLSRLEALFRPMSLRLAQGLVVPSTSERARLARTYNLGRIPIADIPNPLDAEEWRPLARSACRIELGLSEETLVVMNHGRIDIGRKGLDIMLKAWRAFVARRPGARLWIIGSGPDDTRFDEALRQSRVRGVIWERNYSTDRNRLRCRLSAADIYLTTSRIEGMPVAPLEAMALGLAVVATRAQGLADILQRGEGSGGLLVDCNDVGGVVAALDRLATSAELRTRLGQAGRARIEEHFAIPAVANGLRRLLGEAISTG